MVSVRCIDGGAGRSKCDGTVHLGGLDTMMIWRAARGNPGFRQLHGRGNVESDVRYARLR